MSPLDRLAHVGSSGMGALTFEPDHTEHGGEGDFLDLDKIAAESLQVLEGEADDVLEKLINLNGSSAGARPKVVVNVSADMKHVIHGSDIVQEGYSQWMIKFPMSGDPKNSAEMEYKYSLMAHEAGLEMMPTYLFPAKKGAGYFGVKRFDRGNGERVHMHTACGLLNADFRIPSMDYLDLLRATQMLTKDLREVEKMFRLAVFNVLSHNQDDHSKNFSFLMDDQGAWRVSPVYDLTYSSGVGGEQSTMVMGKGKNITPDDLLMLGDTVGLKKKNVVEIYKQVKAVLEN
ncbi:MAG: HipA domain-containing protein [Opitutaceae bacterium]|nr:HipA domain-containing protein [Opitutaceae bacterium]